MSKIALPIVTIIINVRNEEKHIGDLLNSVKELDYPMQRLEVIVVDGGSKDKTLSITSAFKFVKLIESECSLSQGKNIGVKNSTGEIVAFIEGDSTIDRDWVKNVVHHFQELPEISAIGGPYLPGNQKEFFAKYLEVKAVTWFPTETGLTTRAMSLGGGNSAYRKEVFDEIGFFDENLGRGSKIGGGEDIDFNLRLIRSGKKLFYADDVKIYHKFRTTIKDISKYSYQSGVDSSRYSKYSSYVGRIEKLLRNILFPIFFLSFLSLFTISLFFKFFFITYTILFLFLIYYIYKILSFQTKYGKKISLTMKFSKPFIDIYCIFLWSVGAFIELLK